MKVEQEMVIIKANDLEEYQAKHGAADPLPKVHFFSAKIPEDAFDRSKNTRLQNENERLRLENSELLKINGELTKRCKHLEEALEQHYSKTSGQLQGRIREYEARIAKLEKALIEAAIK